MQASRWPLWGATEAVIDAARRRLMQEFASSQTSASEFVRQQLRRGAFTVRKESLSSLMVGDSFDVSGTEEFRSWLEKAVVPRLEQYTSLKVQRELAVLENEAKEELREHRDTIEEKERSLSSCPDYDTIERLAKEKEKKETIAACVAKQAEEHKAHGATEKEEKAKRALEKLEELAKAAEAKYEAAVTPTYAKALADLRAAEAAYESLRVESGIAEKEEQLRQVKQSLGSANQVGGGAFEQTALSAIHQLYDHHPELLLGEPSGREERSSLRAFQWHHPSTGAAGGAGGGGGGGGEEIHSLQNVTLGMANSELDVVVVRASEDRSLLEDITVTNVKKYGKLLRKKKVTACFRVHQTLAIVESKSNCNDVLHSIPRLQEAVSFLTDEREGRGESHARDGAKEQENEEKGEDVPFVFDASRWTTWVYPEGRFLKRSCHFEKVEGGEEGECVMYVFDADARLFERFSRNRASGVFEEGIVYVTKDGAVSLPSSFMERIQLKAARDVTFDVHDDECVERLRLWVLDAMGEDVAHIAKVHSLARRMHNTYVLLLSPILTVAHLKEMQETESAE